MEKILKYIKNFYKNFNAIKALQLFVFIIIVRYILSYYKKLKIKQERNSSSASIGNGKYYNAKDGAMIIYDALYDYAFGSMEDEKVVVDEILKCPNILMTDLSNEFDNITKKHWIWLFGFDGITLKSSCKKYLSPSQYNIIAGKLDYIK